MLGFDAPPPLISKFVCACVSVIGKVHHWLHLAVQSRAVELMEAFLLEASEDFSPCLFMFEANLTEWW